MEDVVMNLRFWKDRTVLITGHTGFKGTWLSLWLQSAGAKVIGYALPSPTEPSMFALTNAGEGIISITGDIRDLDRLERVIFSFKPEVIIHLAAQAILRNSYQDPLETYSTNILGTANILEAVRRSDSTRVVVCVTSDKCYENNEWYWGYRETDAMGGHDPYSSSKACAELIIAAYRNSFFPSNGSSQGHPVLASVRAGNVIGGGDWAKDRLIPDIMKAIVAGQPVIVRNPHATRPWQHVLDPLYGYLTLTERLWSNGSKLAQAWNFGPGDETEKPVSWIVEKIARMWGEGIEWRLDSANHPHENTCLKLDSSKARTLLGWSPKISLITALEWIIEWYRAFKEGKDLRYITETQIARYQELTAA